MGKHMPGQGYGQPVVFSMAALHCLSRRILRNNASSSEGWTPITCECFLDILMDHGFKVDIGPRIGVDQRPVVTVPFSGVAVVTVCLGGVRVIMQEGSGRRVLFSQKVFALPALLIGCPLGEEPTVTHGRRTRSARRRHREPGRRPTTE